MLPFRSWSSLQMCLQMCLQSARWHLLVTNTNTAVWRTVCGKSCYMKADILLDDLWGDGVYYLKLLQGAFDRFGSCGPGGPGVSVSTTAVCGSKQQLPESFWKTIHFTADSRFPVLVLFFPRNSMNRSSCTNEQVPPERHLHCGRPPPRGCSGGPGPSSPPPAGYGAGRVSALVCL